MCQINLYHWTNIWVHADAQYVLLSLSPVRAPVCYNIFVYLALIKPHLNSFFIWHVIVSFLYRENLCPFVSSKPVQWGLFLCSYGSNISGKLDNSCTYVQPGCTTKIYRSCAIKDRPISLMYFKALEEFFILSSLWVRKFLKRSSFNPEIFKNCADYNTTR